MVIMDDICGFLTKLMLNVQPNLTCTSVTSQCDQFVAMVINHRHLKIKKYILKKSETLISTQASNVLVLAVLSQ